MKIVSKIGKVKASIIVLIIIIFAISIPILTSNSKASVNEPPVSVAQYRVDISGEIYYGVAYGIKKDGVLRLESIDYNPEIVELDENYLPAPGRIRLLEMPAGKWKLTDRITGKQIKP